MKRVKVLGPSNDADVTAVELNLAKLVQNAKAHGLKWTKEANYRAKNNRPVDTSEKAVSCCAVGAAMLEEDTKPLNISFFANDRGFDGFQSLAVGTLFNDKELLGLGFRLAMR